MPAPATAALYLPALKALSRAGPGALRKVCALKADVLQQPASSSVYSHSGSGTGSEPDIDLDILSKLAASINKYFDKPALQKAVDFARHQAEWSAALGISIICTFDALYPQRVRLTDDDPVLFWAKGNLSCLNTLCVAVIGTHEPTEHAKITAARVTDYLIAEGACIVSGLALGCDGIAHHQCVQHKTPTIAVLAHGLERIYPPEHEHLAQSILKTGGLLFSHFPLGTSPRAYQFVQRDYLQAALSDFTVLIQANDHGGSLNASGRSQLYGRTLVCAAPTEQDKIEYPERCQANLILTDDAFTPEERASLLHLPADFDPAKSKTPAPAQQRRLPQDEGALLRRAASGALSAANRYNKAEE